jgi:hypothetical protein
LFYWDYGLGMLLMAVLFAFTMGNNFIVFDEIAYGTS